MTLLNHFLLLASLFSSTHAVYTRQKNYDYTNFFNTDSFTFVEGYDSWNKGLTYYVNRTEALASGLAKITSNNQIYLGVDSTNKLTSTTVGPGNGRKSIRLEGVEPFNGGLIVADIVHMPANICGVWGAYWLVKDGIGQFAEVDIIEACSTVTTNWNNAYTMYGSCTMKDGGGQNTFQSGNCKIDPGPGCHTLGAEGTYGDVPNSKSGGFWATQIESGGIKIWFFVRGTEPSDIAADNPDPSKWGQPLMYLAPDSCDVVSTFSGVHLVLNTVLCGSVSSWSWTSCPSITGTSTCESYVANNPSAFANAYWLLNSIKYYSSVTATPTPTVASSTTSTVKSSTLSTIATSSVKTSTTSSSSSSKTSSSSSSIKTSSKTSSTTSSPVSCPTSVAVTFTYKIVTVWGDTIRMPGSNNQLSNWNPYNAPALSANSYTSSNPIWQITLNMAPGTTFQYKFVKVSSSSQVTWQADPNRVYTAPTCKSTDTVYIG